MLGDAKRTSYNSIGFGQGDDQRMYLMWKYDELESLASKTSLKGWAYKDKRSGYEGIGWRFYTTANTRLEQVVKDFHSSEKSPKEISQNVLSQITPLSLAVWYMDDGRTDWYLRYGNTHRRTPECTFCTESFSLSSVELARDWFKRVFGISVRLRNKQLSDRMGYRLVVDKESVYPFFELIKPHIIPSMQYKVDRDAHLLWRNNKKSAKESSLISSNKPL